MGSLLEDLDPLAGLVVQALEDFIRIDRLIAVMIRTSILKEYCVVVYIVVRDVHKKVEGRVVG